MSEGDDVARVEAARRGLQPGDDAAFAVPGSGGVIEAGEAAHPLRAGLGAAHLEIVGGLVGEAVQHRIAGQAEDVVDAVCLRTTPWPRFGRSGCLPGRSAGCAAQCRRMRRVRCLSMVRTSAPDGVLPGRRKDRHRLAALHMVDVCTGRKHPCRSS